MKFHTQVDPMRQRVNVYCEIGEHEGARLFATRGDETTGAVRVPLGAEPPLWDWFPLQVVSELAEALSPRPAATERHLDDALGTRDKLLGMVERIIDADIAREARP